MKPPSEIDNAKVLYWAWSGPVPFGVVKYPNGEIAHEIHGLALCQYAGSDDVYRLSCNANWESQQDEVYGSVPQAMEELPAQYQQVVARWVEAE